MPTEPPTASPLLNWMVGATSAQLREGSPGYRYLCIITFSRVMTWYHRRRASEMQHRIAEIRALQISEAVIHLVPLSGIPMVFSPSVVDHRSSVTRSVSIMPSVAYLSCSFRHINLYCDKDSLSHIED